MLNSPTLLSLFSLSCTGPKASSTTDTAAHAVVSDDTGTPIGDCDDPRFGEVTGQVNEWWDDDDLRPFANPRVHGSNTETTITGLGDETGHYTLTLPVGTWSVRASNADDSCTTSVNEEVAVDGCSRIELDLVMDMWIGR